MTWQNTQKPTTQGWTNINPLGKTQYDQADITYDDSTMFYDGIDPSFWNMVAKPTSSAQVIILRGMATGLITPPTYSSQHIISTDGWTRIDKPTT